MRFSHLLPCALIAAAVATPVLAQESSHATTLKFDFEVVDADQDGYLTSDELIAVMPAVAGKLVAQQLLAAADHDKDGRITAAELTNPATVAGKSAVLMPEIAIMAPFAEVDANRDGKVTLAELDAKALEPIPGTHAMYAQSADSDRDGSISQAEWDAHRPVMTVSTTSDQH